MEPPCRLSVTQNRLGRGRKAGGLLAGAARSEPLAVICHTPSCLWGLWGPCPTSPAPRGRPPGGSGDWLRGASGPRFGPLAGSPRGLRPRGASISGRLPRDPQECDCDGAQHGRDAVRRRKPREPWRACSPPPGPGMRSCRYFSEGPRDLWARCPDAQWDGEPSRPVLARLRPRQDGTSPASTDPSPALWPGRTWSWAKASGRGAGGEVASFPWSSRLSVASQRVSDAARARVLGPATSEGPCLASRMVSDGNVRWACGRAFQDPCLAGRGPWEPRVGRGGAGLAEPAGACARGDRAAG